jgi:hypothetical protein
MLRNTTTSAHGNPWSPHVGFRRDHGQVSENLLATSNLNMQSGEIQKTSHSPQIDPMLPLMC